MKPTRKSTALRILWWLAFAVFMVGLVWLGSYIWQMSKQRREISELSAYVYAPVESPKTTPRYTADITPSPVPQKPSESLITPEITAQPTAKPTQNDTALPTQQPARQPATPVITATPAPTPYIAVPDSAAYAGPNAELAFRLRSLAALNNDFIGWIRIGGTNIDYPVMYSPKSPERYLDYGFDGKLSFSGLPFLDAICTTDDAPGNSIIYAHNMRDGSLFSDLLKYIDREFIDGHSIVQYDTLSGRGEYEIFAVFNMRSAGRAEPSMMCYQLINTADEKSVAELNEYINGSALHSFGQAQIGDRLLTLSTCSKASGDERLVVMSRRVAYEEFEASVQ